METISVLAATNEPLTPLIFLGVVVIALVQLTFGLAARTRPILGPRLGRLVRLLAGRRPPPKAPRQHQD